MGQSRHHGEGARADKAREEEDASREAKARSVRLSFNLAQGKRACRCEQEETNAEFSEVVALLISISRGSLVAD